MNQDLEYSEIPYISIADAEDDLTPVLPVKPLVDRAQTRKVHSAIHRMLDSLCDDTTFAVMVRVFDDYPVNFWDCRPCPASALALLRRMEMLCQTGEKKDRKHGFTVSASIGAVQDEVTRAKVRRIDRLVSELTRYWNCHLAVFWQSATDGPSHFRVVNEGVAVAFEDFAKFLSEADDSAQDST